MRGQNTQHPKLFHTFDIEERVPQAHPLRKIKVLASKALASINKQLDAIYSEVGRPSIPPERLLFGKLLIFLHSIRSERMFCEQLGYNMLFRWFLNMDPDEEAFNHSVFSHNCERLMQRDVAKAFFQAVLAEARKSNLLSDEHFSVDGTLIEAWASQKSFQPKSGDGKKPDPGGEVDFHGEQRRNDTHQSTTDPDSRLMRKAKGKEAKLSYQASVAMENRNGMCVEIQLDRSVGVPEHVAATQILSRLRKQGNSLKTVGADKGYCARKFVKAMKRMGVKPHVAKIEGRTIPGLDGRTLRSQGYKISQVIRKRIEEIFGWIKTVGGWRKTRYRGLAKNRMESYFVAAAYNLTRMSRLCPG